MKKWLGIMMSICMACVLIGCGSLERKTSDSYVDNSQSIQNKNVLEDDDTEDSEPISDKTEDSMSISSVVVYFSGTANTEMIAQNIAEELSSSIYEIEPAEKYTDADLNYSDDNCRANREQNDDSARPEIANDLSEVTEYETIYLGYPIWWGTNPKIIQTFLDIYDLSGKTIYTFCTSGSSGVETSVSNLQTLYPKINIVSGHRFETNASQDDISDWLIELQ